jgi:hypothetical protein
MTEQSHKNKEAMVVPNNCSLDYRVSKQAESLALAGYEVRVYCTWKPGSGIPIQETINGVTYIRREWDVIGLIKEKLFRIPRPSDTVRLRNRYQETDEAEQ